jgi:hypothetical protein
MTPDRKKPGVAFWATVVVVVVLLIYPAMWGPLWWAHVRLGEPQWSARAIMVAYAPLMWVIHRSPPWVANIFVQSRFWGMNAAEEQNRRAEGE